MRRVILIRYGVVALVLLCAVIALGPVSTPDRSGSAQVIDGNTIVIAGERHRLYGVDAVELDQTCTAREGGQWPCGREAAEALRRFLEGRRVGCETREHDDDGRHVSICYAGKDNLSAWVAREGWAVADRDAPRLLNFSSEEGAARFLRKGIWSGIFERPEAWRRKQR